MALYLVAAKDLLMGTLGIVVFDAYDELKWLLMNVVGLCLEEEASLSDKWTQNEWDELEVHVTKRSEDCRWTPTTPTSRRIAPAMLGDLEAGTWTGSEDEEYTPMMELADWNVSEWAWDLLLTSLGTILGEFETYICFSFGSDVFPLPLDFSFLLWSGLESHIPFRFRHTPCPLEFSKAEFLRSIRIPLGLKEKKNQ